MELWDIYDENKQLTGRTMRRNDWNMKPGDFHLTVLGVIRRPDGRFLITQRVMTKSWAPGWWEVSGGGVMAGESSEQAVQREICEETGLDVTDAAGGYLFTYQRVNPDEGDNYFVDVYRFDMDVKDEDVHIQEKEALGFRFATLDEIKQLAEDGIFLHYSSIRQAFED
ncbi:MAG: NUDIX hydrolase [Eubacteriales bacterium]|nr:NUDIX hydrolase [Eubacteriales bacterium]